jgi:hypothetical protein
VASSRSASLQVRSPVRGKFDPDLAGAVVDDHRHRRLVLVDGIPVAPALAGAVVLLDLDAGDQRVGVRDGRLHHGRVLGRTGGAPDLDRSRLEVADLRRAGVGDPFAPCPPFAARAHQVEADNHEDQAESRPAELEE